MLKIPIWSNVVFSSDFEDRERDKRERDLEESELDEILFSDWEAESDNKKDGQK